MQLQAGFNRFGPRVAADQALTGQERNTCHDLQSALQAFNGGAFSEYGGYVGQPCLLIGRQGSVDGLLLQQQPVAGNFYISN
ncbi:hypothetical protein PC358_02295 [Pseudomonas capeferrum]|nr:hypothetical protein PC358_02295 [Pseudomonas capeferrum]